MQKQTSADFKHMVRIKGAWSTCTDWTHHQHEQEQPQNTRSTKLELISLGHQVNTLFCLIAAKRKKGRRKRGGVGVEEK